MSNIRICAQNFFDDATLTESPAMLTTLPSTNAQLVARDKTARSAGAASITQTIKGTWADGAARTIDSFFVFRHNGQGGTVRLRLYANADWTGTTQDTTALAMATAITSAGYSWGGSVSSPDSVNDLLLAEAPYWIFVTAFAAKSFQIDFSSGVRSYWDIGRIFLGKYLEAPFNPKDGMTITQEYNDIQTRTKGGSLRTRAGEKWWVLKVDMYYEDDANRALWRDLISKIQLNRNVAVAVFPGAGSRQERDYIFNMQLQAPASFAWQSLLINESTYTFTEV